MRVHTLRHKMAGNEEVKVKSEVDTYLKRDTRKLGPFWATWASTTR